jgi:hypothetical protein
MTGEKKPAAAVWRAIVFCFAIVMLPAPAMTYNAWLEALAGEPHKAGLLTPAAAGEAPSGAPDASAATLSPELPSGAAPEPEAAQPAPAAAQNAEEAPKPFVTRLSNENGSITLRGDVPSDEDKKTIQGVIAATFPGLAFVDKTRNSQAVTDRDAWLAGMNFALRQLAKLERGTAVLTNNVVSFDGAARNEQDFKLLQQKVQEEAPDGVTLGQVTLKPPSVSPFVWLAQLQGGSVNLSGHVPLEVDHDLFSYAKSLFSAFQVNNSMAMALGAPKQWADAARLSLEILGLLQQGTVMLTDTVITVDGVLAASNTLDQVRAMGSLVPRGYKFEVSVAEPEIAPARATGALVDEVSVASKSMQ